MVKRRASGGGLSDADLLPHLPGHRHHRLPGERRHHREGPADRRPRDPQDHQALRPHQRPDHARRDRENHHLVKIFLIISQVSRTRGIRVMALRLELIAGDAHEVSDGKPAAEQVPNGAFTLERGSDIHYTIIFDGRRATVQEGDVLNLYQKARDHPSTEWKFTSDQSMQATFRPLNRILQVINFTPFLSIIPCWISHCRCDWLLRLHRSW